MNFVYQDQNFCIIDDFLDDKLKTLVWNYVQTEEFRHVRDPKWDKAFRLQDGNPLRGPAYLSHKNPLDEKRPTYPTRKGIDIVFKNIIENMDKISKWVGSQDKDWAFFFARAYIYEMNQGLSWHRDNNYNATGAFVYYAHPYWEYQWGGELLIDPNIDRSVENPTIELYEEGIKRGGSHLDTTHENKLLGNKAFGHFIQPKPNRLVILKSGIYHTIKKVDPSAGDNVRAIIQGFFLHPKKD